jgi:hypothetical protein
MKINGPGQPAAPDAPAAADAADKAAKREGATGASESPSSGKVFSEKLAGITARGKPGAPQAAGPVEPTRAVPVGDLAADLRAGKVTPGTAVDKVVERILDRQLGPDAPAGIRDRVRDALQDALESDPTLAEKLTRLQ